MGEHTKADGGVGGPCFKLCVETEDETCAQKSSTKTSIQKLLGGTEVACLNLRRDRKRTCAQNQARGPSIQSSGGVAGPCRNSRRDRRRNLCTKIKHRGSL